MVRNGKEAQSTKEAHRAKATAYYQTSNGQHAWDEHARNENAGD